MITFLALAIAVGYPPDSVANTAQLSRTMIPRGSPRGFGCLQAAQTGSGAAGFTDEATDLPAPIPMNSQIWVTNNSTVAATYCFSMDPTPTINRKGVFSADGDSLYPAGRGNCFSLNPGSWPILASYEMFPEGYSASTRAPGSRLKMCSAGSRPCAANDECRSGATCNTTTRPTHVYLFAQHRAGTSNDSDACDAR
jgi:hypothetical protein